MFSTLLLSCALIPGQNPPPTEKPSASPEFELRLADETLIRATMAAATLEVKTEYGTLKVPVKDIRRIQVGFRYPEGVLSKAQGYVEDLGNSDFKTREEAQKALIALGEYAVPSCKAALKNKDKEVVTRVEAVLKTLTEKLTEEKMNPKLKDFLETAEFTFEGVIETSSLKVTTKFFGDSTVKLADLRTVKAIGVPGVGGNLKVDAAIYGKPNDATWMDTGIEIRAERAMEVTATGQVDLWPQQPGGYLTNADANPRQGNVSLPIGPGGGSLSVPAGMLLGKIGENGTVIQLGSNYKSQRAGTTGKLYLKIAGSPWGNPSSGTYTVVVK
jgi:hypothetical protein